METSGAESHICISADGVWYYGDTPLERLGLIRLFYSVLKKEADQYYLVTPVEKVPVVVKDVPYSVLRVEQTERGIECILNDQTSVIFDTKCSPRIGSNYALYIRVKGEHEARFTRSAYAQIAAWIEQESEDVYSIRTNKNTVYLSQHQ